MTMLKVKVAHPQRPHRFQTLEAFKKDQPERLRRLLALVCALLKAGKAEPVINGTCYDIGNSLKSNGLPTNIWLSGCTQRDPTTQGYLKAQWIETTGAGERGEVVAIPTGLRRLHEAESNFQTGDLARLNCAHGKSASVWTKLLASSQRRGS